MLFWIATQTHIAKSRTAAADLSIGRWRFFNSKTNPSRQLVIIFSFLPLVVAGSRNANIIPRAAHVDGIRSSRLKNLIDFTRPHTA